MEYNTNMYYLNLVFVQHYIDINECSDTTLCDQICVEVKGSYRCQCENGFRLQTDGRTCAGTAELDHNKHNTQNRYKKTQGNNVNEFKIPVQTWFIAKIITMRMKSTISSFFQVMYTLS